MARAFRLVVAALLTVFIIWTADPRRVLAAAAGADWRWISAAIALTFVDRTLMAYRWIVLLCALTPGSRPPFGAVLKIFFVSTFIGTFLPGAGGDLYRAYRLSRLGVSGVEAAASVAMDRVLGVISIVIVGIAALLTARTVVRIPGIWSALGAASLLCAMAVLAVYSDRAAAVGQAIVARMPHGKAQRLGAGFIDAFRRYADHPPQLAGVLATSTLVQALRVLQAFCLGESLGLDVPLWIYFTLVPVILLIMMLPITVAGLGTSQVAFSWLFGTAGVAPAPAVALSILFVALGLVGNLPGALLYVFDGRQERPAA